MNEAAIIAHAQAIVALAQGGVPAPDPTPPGTTPAPTIPPTPGTTPLPAGTRVVELGWNQDPQYIYIDPFGPDEVIAVKFTTGGISSSNNLPSIVATEDHNGAPQERIGVISESPGDFASPIGPVNQGNTITRTFVLGDGPDPYFGIPGLPQNPRLKLNTMYYLNLKCSPGAPQQNLPMRVDLHKNQL